MPSIRRTGKRKEIAQRIRRKREAIGKSQEVAAKQLGVSRFQWIHLERGRRSIPAERLLDVCEIIEATPTELLGAA